MKIKKALNVLGLGLMMSGFSVGGVFLYNQLTSNTSKNNLIQDSNANTIKQHSYAKHWEPSAPGNEYPYLLESNLLPKSNLNAETLIPVLKSELSRQFNEQFGNTNQYDIKNIDFQNNTAEVVAKDFATDYEPGSTTKIKWNIEELIPLPASITLPTQYSSQLRDLYDTHQYSEQDVFKILAKENKTLNFSELTIEDFNANAGVITLKAKPTSTVYRTGTTFPVYVNLSHAVRLEYTTTNLVRGSTIYSPTFKYHDQTIAISSDYNAFTFDIFGGTKKGDSGKMGDVNGNSTILFDKKDGRIQYKNQDTIDFVGGIYTVKVTYTVQETFEDKTGEVKYSSYWSFYAPPYTAPKDPEIMFGQVSGSAISTGMYDNKDITFSLHTIASGRKIPKDYFIWFSVTYRSYADDYTHTAISAKAKTDFSVTVAKLNSLGGSSRNLNIVMRASKDITASNTQMVTITGGDNSWYTYNTTDVATAIICKNAIWTT